MKLVEGVSPDRSDGAWSVVSPAGDERVLRMSIPLSLLKLLVRGPGIAAPPMWSCLCFSTRAGARVVWIEACAPDELRHSVEQTHQLALCA
jgi:hypothetical protein